MKKVKTKCQVCFFDHTTGIQSTQIITCKGCKRTAHRYCYSPDSQDKNFHCDACVNKVKNPQCCICHNQGLVKKTQQGNYGHPICLITCRDSLVRSYQKLQFHYVISRRKSKTSKCNICNKNSFISDLFNCFEKDCTKSAHYYCILKQQWKDNQQTNKWVQQLKIFDNLSFNYLKYFQNKIKKYIKITSILAYRAIYGQNKIVQEHPIFITYCRDHCQNLNNCYCVALQDLNLKVDWVFCDSCAKWYHFQCEQIQNCSQEEYTCKSCKIWQSKFLSKQQPIVKIFPRLHFYDLVQIQLYAEKKSYKISANLNQLLKRVPFTSSVKYFSQILKNNAMNQKIIKSINFLTIKKLIINKQVKKQLTKLIEKPDKNLTQILWKLDFLGTGDLNSLQKIKKLEFKMQEVIQIFQKYEKKFAQGSNIIKPAIKEIQKLKNVIKDQQDDDEMNENQTANMKQATQLLKNFIKQSKKSIGNIQARFNLLKIFFEIFNECELLKQIIKDFMQQKKQLQITFQPIFIYDNQQDMFIHSRLSYKIKQFKNLELQKYQQKSLKILSKQIKTIYISSSYKVQLQINKNYRQIQSFSYTYQNQNQNYLCNRMISNGLSFNKNTINNQCKNLWLKQNSLIEIQSILLHKIKLTYIQNFIKNLQLKRTCLTRLQIQLSKFRNVTNKQQTNLYIKSYLQLFKSCRKLIQGIPQPTILQDLRLDIDLLQIIKKIKIDRCNIYKFCTFFIDVCKLKLSISKLNIIYQDIFKQKCIQFLTLIQSRSMIFQCQSEFKAAYALINKYKYKYPQYPKILQIIKNNKQLLQIIKDITLQSLQNFTFVESDLLKLQQAKQFCHQNNLQFRINKIQYMIRLYQLKQQAFKYFPVNYIIKDITNIPRKFINNQNQYQYQTVKSIDFGILKKFLYKMKLLKYPHSDYMSIKIVALFNQSYEYYNILSTIITNYNLLLNNPNTVLTQPKLKIQQILYLIKNNSNKFVTCRPEQQQIQIMCQLYSQLLKKMERLMKNNVQNISQLIKIYKQFMKYPFQCNTNNNTNNVFNKYCTYLHGIVQKRKNITTQVQLQPECIQIQNLCKKNQLDQTSAKGQNSNKSIKNKSNLVQQIQNKPRSFNFQQVQIQYNKTYNSISTQEKIKLQQIMNSYKKLHKQNYEVIDKYMKGSQFSQVDIKNVTKMIKNYENQFICDEVLEKMGKQFKVFQKITNQNSFDESLMKNLNKSFLLFLMKKLEVSQSNSSRLSEDIQVKNSSSKIKKTKVVLRK